MSQSSIKTGPCPIPSFTFGIIIHRLIREGDGPIARLETLEEGLFLSKILYLDQKPAMAPEAAARLQGLHSVVLPDDASEEQLLNEIQDAKYVVAGGRKVTAQHLQSAPLLRCVLVPGAGVDHVDVESATAHGIQVVNAPGANAIAVAEIALGLMLAVARSIPQTYAGVRAGGWVDDTIRAQVVGSELSEKTLGLVGLGNIGSRVARIAKGFEMKVLCYTRRPDPQRAVKAGVVFVSLEELLSNADFVVICAALTPSTRGLIGEKELSLMKKDAYLVNCARGPIVDEAALYSALRNGQLKGAGLDVLSVEPPGAHHPLFELPNVVVTPHLGSRTKGAIDRVSHMIADEILRMEAGEQPLNLVNREVIGKN